MDLPADTACHAGVREPWWTGGSPISGAFDRSSFDIQVGFSFSWDFDIHSAREWQS